VGKYLDAVRASREAVNAVPVAEVPPPAEPVRVDDSAPAPSYLERVRASRENVGDRAPTVRVDALKEDLARGGALLATATRAERKREGASDEEADAAAKAITDTALVLGDNADSGRVREALAARVGVDTLDKAMTRAFGQRIMEVPLAAPTTIERQARLREQERENRSVEKGLAAAWNGEGTGERQAEEGEIRPWVEAVDRLGWNSGEDVLTSVFSGGLVPAYKLITNAPEIVKGYATDKDVQKLTGMAGSAMSAGVAPLLSGGEDPFSRTIRAMAVSSGLPDVTAEGMDALGFDSYSVSEFADNVHAKPEFDAAAYDLVTKGDRAAFEAVPFNKLPEMAKGELVDAERVREAIRNGTPGFEGLAGMEGLRDDVLSTQASFLPVSVIRSIQPDAVPDDLRIKDVFAKREAAKPWRGDDMGMSAARLMNSALLRPAGDGKTLMVAPGRFQELLRFANAVPAALMNVDAGTDTPVLNLPLALPRAALYAAEAMGVPGAENVRGKVEAFKVPTTAGVESMIQSGEYDDLLESMGFFTSDTYANRYDPESTWLSRTLTEIANPDAAGQYLGDTYERLGGDPESTTARVLGTADLAVNVLMPAEELALLPIAKATAATNRARRAANAARELGLNGKAARKAAKEAVFVGSDPRQAVADSLTRASIEGIRDGTLNPAKVPLATKKAIESVLRAAGMPEDLLTVEKGRPHAKIWDDLADRRARILETAADFETIGGPATQKLRASPEYRAVADQLDVFTRTRSMTPDEEAAVAADVAAGRVPKMTGNLSMRDRDLVLRFLEAAAFRAADDGVVKSPEEYFARHSWEVGKEGEALPAGTLNQTTTVRSGEESMKKYGLEPGKKYTNRQVAEALEKRQRAKYGSIAAEDRSPEARAKIAKWIRDEVLFSINNPKKSGVGWYSTEFQKALDTVGERFPELLDDQDARDLMTVLFAITSDGKSVPDNLKQALDLYEARKVTGSFTEMGHSSYRDALSDNLATLQDLYESRTPAEVRQYLMEEITVADYNKAMRAAGKPDEVIDTYQGHVRIPRAAAVLGAKLGAFYANLMGAEGYLTMDRWWSRSFNRYRGTLLSHATETGKARVKEMLGNPDMSDADLMTAIKPIVKAYDKSGFKDKTPLNVAANTVWKNANELEDSPFGAPDRTFMIDTVREAQRLLRQKGHAISAADIQAILWYYEKRLYGELGARNSLDAAYSDIARNVIDAYKRGVRPGTPDVGAPVARQGVDVAEGMERLDRVDPGGPTPDVGAEAFDGDAANALAALDDPDRLLSQESGVTRGSIERVSPERAAGTDYAKAEIARLVAEGSSEVAAAMKVRDALPRRIADMTERDLGIRDYFTGGPTKARTAPRRPARPDPLADPAVVAAQRELDAATAARQAIAAEALARGEKPWSFPPSPEMRAADDVVERAYTRHMLALDRAKSVLRSEEGGVVRGTIERVPSDAPARVLPSQYGVTPEDLNQTSKGIPYLSITVQDVDTDGISMELMSADGRATPMRVRPDAVDAEFGERVGTHIRDAVRRFERTGDNVEIHPEGELISRLFTNPDGAPDHVDVRTMLKAVVDIADETDDILAAELARNLLDNADSDLFARTSVELVPYDGENVGAYYDGMVTLTRDVGPRVALHEAAHAATYRILHADPATLSEAGRTAVRRLNELYDEVKASGRIPKAEYGFTNIDEFVAEAYSNDEFQSWLRSVPVAGSSRSLWDAFVETISEWLGLSSSDAFAHVMANTQIVIRERPSGATATPSAPLFSRKGDTIRGAISPDARTVTVDNPEYAAWVAREAALSAEVDALRDAPAAVGAEVPNPAYPDAVKQVQATDAEIRDIKQQASRAFGVNPAWTAWEAEIPRLANDPEALGRHMAAQPPKSAQHVNNALIAQKEADLAALRANIPPKTLTQPAPVDPAIAAREADLAATRAAEPPRTVTKPDDVSRWLLKLFRTGDVKTALHEGTHLLDLMMGEEWTRKAMEALGYDPTGPITTEVRERIAEAGTRALRGTLRPGTVLGNVMEDLRDTVGDVWRRVKREPAVTTPAFRKLWDKTFAPDDAEMMVAAHLVDQHGTGPLGRVVTTSGNVAEEIREGAQRAAGQAENAANVMRANQEVRQALGLTNDMDTIAVGDLLGRALAYTATTHALRGWGFGDLEGLTARTAVPAVRAKRIRNEVAAYRKAVLGGKDAPVPTLVDGREVFMLNRDQQAGVRRMLADLANEPVSVDLPERLQDPRADLSQITREEWANIADRQLEVRAGAGAWRDRLAERAAVSAGVRFGQMAMDAARNQQSAVSAEANALRDAFVTTIAADEYLNPATREVLKSVAREIGESGSRVKNAVIKAMNGGEKAWAEAFKDVAAALPPEVVPVEELRTLRRVEPLATADTFEQVATGAPEIQRLFTNAPLGDTEQTVQEWAGLTVIDRVNWRVREDGMDFTAAISDAGYTLDEVNDAMARVQEGIKRRVAVFDNRASEIMHAFAGSDDAQVFAGMDPARLAAAKYRAYESWYTGDWADNLLLNTELGQAARGPVYDQGMAVLNVLTRLEAAKVRASLARRLADVGVVADPTSFLRGGVRLDRPYVFGSAANDVEAITGEAYKQDVMHYLAAFTGWKVTSTNRLPTMETEGVFVPGTGMRAASGSVNKAAASDALRMIQSWGMKMGKGSEWETITLPDGGQIVMPTMFREPIEKALADSAPLGGAFTSGPPKLGNIVPGTDEPIAAHYRAVNAALTMLGTAYQYSFGMLKTGLTTGMGPLIRPAFFMGQFIGGMGQLYQGVGAIKALEIMARPLLPTAEGRMTRAVIARMWNNGAGLTGTGAMMPAELGRFDVVGRWHSDQSLASGASRAGLNSSLVKTEFAQSIAEDIKAAEPTLWNRLMDSPKLKAAAGAVIGGAVAGLGGAVVGAGAFASLSRTWQDFFREAATGIDNYYRVSTYIGEVLRGVPEEQAAELARRVAFDYNNVTEFEKNYLRKGVLFYSFQRNNQNLFWWTLLNHPSRIMVQLRALRGAQQENFGEDAELFAPTWGEGRVPFRFRPAFEAGHADRATQGAVTLTPRLSIADAVGLWQSLLGVTTELDPSAAGDLASKLNPWIQLSFVMSTGQDIHWQRSIEGFNTIPNWFVEMDENLTGGMVVNDLFGKIPAQYRNPSQEGYPGAPQWIVKPDGPHSRAWWVFRQMTMGGAMLDTITAMQRADFGDTLIEGGIVQKGVDLSREVARADGREPLRNEPDTEMARSGLTEAEELGSWLGFKPVQVLDRDQALAPLIQRRESEQNAKMRTLKKEGERTYH